MKGVFLQQQCEYRLEVAGDGFRQGEAVPCTLSVKNHASAPQPLNALSLRLACGDLKKVRDKSEDAFKIISCADLNPQGEVGAGQQQSFSWTFELDRNCPISEKSQSLYLLYGSTTAAIAAGQLPLTVAAHPHIEAVLRLLESSFQFVLRGQKSSKGWVQAKFKPPTSRRFSLVNELTLSLRFEESLLVLNYSFNVKKFDATTASVGVKKGKSELEQRLDPARYMLTGQHADDQVLGAALEEALSTVATGL
jgi:hypothetical protein